MVAAGLAIVALFGLLGQSNAGSSYIAKLCRSQTCTDPRFPLLDYDPREGKCTCSAHPCWDDAGVTHVCPQSSNPYLEFSFTSDRKLTCRCLDRPFYNSRHIMHDLCAGHNCERPDHPLLDWDEHNRKCFCRAHPCMDLEGLSHTCPEDKVLRYREDEPVSGFGRVKGICECIPKLDHPTLGTDL